MATKKIEEASVLVFSKKQILSSNKYARFHDFLNGNLEDNKMYSIQDVDVLIEKYMKGIGE